MRDDLSRADTFVQTKTATIFARTVATYLAIFALFLCMMHVLAIPAYVDALNDRSIYVRIAKYFNLNNEDNIPSWFAVNLLSLNAVLLGLNAVWTAKGKDFLSWVSLGAIFLFLSLDEMVSIHEKIGGAISSHSHLGGLLTFAWVLPGAIFTIFVALSFLRLLLRLPRRISALFVLAGAIYVGGALITESIEGYFYSISGKDALFYWLVLIEESMEMFGQILFCYALLLHLSLLGANFSIRRTAAEEESG